MRQIARTACDGIPSTRIIRLSFFVPSSGSPDARDLLENLGWLRILLKAAAVALELDIVMAAGSKGPGPEERRPETRLLIGFGHARAYRSHAPPRDGSILVSHAHHECSLRFLRRT